MRSRYEVEIYTATNIVGGMEDTLARLERFWPPSKRGSNAQRELDTIKAQRRAIAVCLCDAMDALQKLTPVKQGDIAGVRR